MVNLKWKIGKWVANASQGLPAYEPLHLRPHISNKLPYVIYWYSSFISLKWFGFVHWAAMELFSDPLSIVYYIWHRTLSQTGIQDIKMRWFHHLHFFDSMQQHEYIHWHIAYYVSFIGFRIQIHTKAIKNRVNIWGVRPCQNSIFVVLYERMCTHVAGHLDFSPVQ